jgi:superfamily II DNA or RNA helicase
VTNIKINYEWQEKFLAGENNYAMLCCETGTGKSYTAGKWLDQNQRKVNAVIFCPKQIVSEWQSRADTENVFTPQTILKSELPSNPTAIVVDEADAFASPLFVPKKRSKCADKLYNYIRTNPQAHVLLLTATPVRSTPWNLHTLLCYLGKYIDFKSWRDKYFFLDTPRYMTRPAYFPRPGWQKQMQEVIDEHATVALLRDMVPDDQMPPKTHEVINFKAPNYEKNEEWEASKQFQEDNLLEHPAKDKKIAEISRGYRKVVVVAYRRDEIDRLHKKLSKERETFVLDGRTGDVAKVIAAAENSDECYIIVQSGIGAGFELHTFSCMIFQSKSYPVRDYVQMKGRIVRSESLKPVIYYHLLGGRCDKMIHESIEQGKDFVPSEYRP